MRTVSRTWAGALVLVDGVVGGGYQSQSHEICGLWLPESNSLDSSLLQNSIKNLLIKRDWFANS